jgi:PAS domain S-box-containing protein
MRTRSDHARSDPASAATSRPSDAVRHEAMLAALEATALSLAGAIDWRGAIGSVLARLGEASDVSRVTLFEIHPGPAGLPAESCRFDWAEPGLARLAGDPRYVNIPIADPASGSLDDWAQRRAAGEIVAALREETTGDTRRFFEEHGTLSFLSVPLHVDGQWWGFLGFDDCRTARRWSALETGLLRTAATMVAGAIQRETYERRLRQSEERYALATRGANDGLFDVDLVAGSGYFSERVAEILGTAPSATGGIAVLEPYLADGEPARFRRHLEGVLAARAPQFEIEARLAAAPDGLPRWIVLRGLVLYDEAGRAVRLVGSLRDISARKRAETALAEARQQLAVAIEAIQDGFVLFDAEDRLALFNRHYLERFSANPAAVRIGMTIGELLAVEAEVRFPGATRQAERDRWVAEKVLEHRSLVRDFVHRRHNGRWALLNEYRTVDGGIVGVLTDVTELKNRELELERNRRLLKAVVDAVPAMINVKDRESRYLLMNRFQAELYGTTSEGALGRTAGEIMGADYGDQARAFDQRVLQSGKQSAVMEHDFVDVRGETHDWYTIKLPLAGDGEVAEGIITVALDVTQLIRLERARVNLARYVPPSMATILAESDEPMGPPRQQDVAVLFADIVGFTQLTADMPADRLFELLRGFQSRLADIVFAHGGTLDKFTGDGAMATFGTPDNGPNDAGNALACAIAIVEATDRLNLARAEVGEPPIAIAIGLHCGPALLGNVGDERRLEFAVIGDTVNVAARLEELARELAARVVASETLCAAVEREIATGGGGRALLARLEPRPAQALRGRRSPVGIRILPAH